MKFAAAVLSVCFLVPAQAGLILLTSSDNRLLSADTGSLGIVNDIGAITGLQSGENILGIDARPANGQLYALGSSSRLYTINTTTGVATQVGASGAFTLSGTAFGFDFNPTVDRIRVTSNTGQNLRLNPNDGTLTATDTALNPGTPNIAGAAYTNSVSGALTTTLYVIDYSTDSLYIQNPPNNGTLTLVGALGVDITSNVGFDISPLGNTGYAALASPGGFSRLYTLNLNTGAATLVGQIGAGVTITGLALPSVAPEPATFALMGLGLAALGAWKRRKP